MKQYNYFISYLCKKSNGQKMENAYENANINVEGKINNINDLRVIESILNEQKGIEDCKIMYFIPLNKEKIQTEAV